MTVSIADVDPRDLPSDRSFGLLMAGVALAAGSYLLLRGRALPAALLLLAGVVLLMLAALAPTRLASFNRAWFMLGLALATTRDDAPRCGRTDYRFCACQPAPRPERAGPVGGSADRSDARRCHGAAFPVS